jgi:general secretion pathway protein K
VRRRLAILAKQPRRARPAARPGERGFALLIVVWTLVLLTLIVTQVTASGRMDVRLSTNLRDAAAAEAEADGVVFVAIAHLVDGSPRRWAADGSVRDVPVAQGRARVRIRSEEGKFDLNSAPVPTLVAVLRAAGADNARADDLARAIDVWRFPSAAFAAAEKAYAAAGRDYRPPQQAFQSIAELGLVLGMTPDVVTRLRDYLTIWHEGDPDPRDADPAVRDILAAQGPGRAVASPDARLGKVATIEADVTLGGGAGATRRAVVRVGANEDQGGWRILDWR